MNRILKNCGVNFERRDRGKKLVLVNKTPTPRDSIADLIVQGSIGEIFSQLD